MISTWNNLDRLDKLLIVWAFLLQIVLIVHFAIRKPLFESYTLKYGWIVYALCIPAVVISVILLRGGKSWFFWLGGSFSFSMPSLAIGSILWHKTHSETRSNCRSRFHMWFYIWPQSCSTGGRFGGLAVPCGWYTQSCISSQLF
jgi:hypothetical protein